MYEQFIFNRYECSQTLFQTSLAFINKQTIEKREKKYRQTSNKILIALKFPSSSKSKSKSKPRPKLTNKTMMYLI